MKKVACTILTSDNQQIVINEYDNGSYEEVVNGCTYPSSLNYLQILINTGKYQVQELTF